MNQPIAISVILACAERKKRTVVPCLAALQSDLAGIRAEVLVVGSPDARADGTLATNVRRFGGRLVDAPDRLVPELWAYGWRISSGRAVAFLIPECVVRPGWAQALLAEIDAGAVGAGGLFRLHSTSTPTDAAVYFLRYSDFSGDLPGATDVRHIAGDNAMYQRTALLRHSSTFTSGFWEVDFHRRVLAEGERLVLVPAVADFSGAPRLSAMVRQRLIHARHFGAWRKARDARPAWITVVLAPAVPALLIARIVRRAWAARRDRMRLLFALPALGVLSCAWAMGEVIGALTHPSNS